MTVRRTVISLWLLPEHDLFRKPTAAFRDHALGPCRFMSSARRHEPSRGARGAFPLLLGIRDRARSRGCKGSGFVGPVSRDGALHPLSFRFEAAVGGGARPGIDDVSDLVR